MMTRKNHIALALFALGFAFCACSFAQKTKPSSNPVPANTASAHLAKPSPAVPVAPPSPVPVLSQPAGPATITLAAGQLSIKANNSNLSDILNQIAKAGGMKVEGLQSGGNGDERIFGSYGPGAPRKVLSELLDGSGFNVIMLGKTPAGTPKSLSLSPRAPGGLPNPPAQSAAAQDQNYRENYMPQPTAYPQPQRAAPYSTVKPPRNGIRTPQEILQELEQMRRQQSQQPK